MAAAPSKKDIPSSPFIGSMPSSYLYPVFFSHQKGSASAGYPFQNRSPLHLGFFNHFKDAKAET